MHLTLAILSGIAAMVALVAAVATMSRRLRLVQRLAFPLYVAAVAAGLKVATLFEAAIPDTFDRTLSWILYFLISILALKVLGLYVFEVYLHGKRGMRLPPVLPNATMAAVYFVAALVTLRFAFPEIPLAPLVTTSAVTSLVLGLALQPILGNFFSGVVLSLDRPFRINDWIKVGETEGRVSKITWRTTHLRTRDNDNLVIPNSRIADQEVLNYFYPHPLHLERIYVGAHYRTPPYRVKQALMDVAERVDSVLGKPSPAVYLHSFDDSAITYELRVWIEDIAHRPRIASHLRSEIWEEFRRRGITIPFPIRTLEIEPRAGTLELARAARPATEPEAVKAPPAQLYVSRGSDRGRFCALDGGPVTVGRSGGCALRLTEPRASKEHLRIEWRDGSYVARDLESQYGTRINAKKLSEEVLHDLDHLMIGDTVIVFEVNA